MCRFLLARSGEAASPASLLEEFAEMCAESRTVEGDRQEDGWGIAWLESGVWNRWRSLRPIWEEKRRFPSFPPTTLFAVHARSAGFPDQRGVLAYNQPFLDHSVCFVFNGMIQGMRLNRPLAGRIGAQKVFSWAVERMREEKADGETTLRDLRDWVLGSARQVVALNVGMISGGKLLALCQYLDRPQYFTLHHTSRGDLTLICSGQVGSYVWNEMGSGEVLSL